MKTLDEVIMCLEGCGHIDCDDCPYHYEDEKIEIDDCEQVYKDALQYLKYLQKYYEMCETSQKLRNTSQITCPKCHSEFVILPESNNALTWDELKQMAGKPVWLEVDGNWYGKFWAFVEVENDAYVNFYQKGQDYPEDLWKRDIGKTWQAFKKERG
jgi:hypothetical protein